jgi:hypothetical protein
MFAGDVVRGPKIRVSIISVDAKKDSSRTASRQAASSTKGFPTNFAPHDQERRDSDNQGRTSMANFEKSIGKVGPRAVIPRLTVK